MILDSEEIIQAIENNCRYYFPNMTFYINTGLQTFRHDHFHRIIRAEFIARHVNAIPPISGRHPLVAACPRGRGEKGHGHRPPARSSRVGGESSVMDYHIYVYGNEKIDGGLFIVSC